MSASSHLRGHLIVDRDGIWVYADTGEPINETWRQRGCGYCDRPDTAEGHDACLGTLRGVSNACCGHGQTEHAYVQFAGGRTARGTNAEALLAALSSTVPDAIETEQT